MARDLDATQRKRSPPWGVRSIGGWHDRSHRSQWERRERRFVRSTRGKQMAKYFHPRSRIDTRDRRRVGRVFRGRFSGKRRRERRAGEMKGKKGEKEKEKKGGRKKGKKKGRKGKRGKVDDEQVGRDWTRDFAQDTRRWWGWREKGERFGEGGGVGVCRFGVAIGAERRDRGRWGKKEGEEEARRRYRGKETEQRKSIVRLLIEKWGRFMGYR